MTAKRITDTFKQETINVIRYEFKKLSSIKGITLDRAMEISKEFNEKWELWHIVSFLEKFGISSNKAKKVFDELGETAISKIEENPYILIDITYGVNFKLIDDMAINLGINPDNEKRLESRNKVWAC